MTLGPDPGGREDDEGRVRRNQDGWQRVLSETGYEHL